MSLAKLTDTVVVGLQLEGYWQLTAQSSCFPATPTRALSSTLFKSIKLAKFPKSSEVPSLSNTLTKLAKYAKPAQTSEISSLSSVSRAWLCGFPS